VFSNALTYSTWHSAQANQRSQTWLARSKMSLRIQQKESGQCQSWTYCRSYHHLLLSCCMPALAGWHCSLACQRLTLRWSYIHCLDCLICFRVTHQHSCQLLFENVSFLRQFGLPRSQLEYSNMWDRLSEADQQAKWDFIADVLQASFPIQKLDVLLLNNQSRHNSKQCQLWQSSDDCRAAKRSRRDLMSTNC